MNYKDRHTFFVLIQSIEHQLKALKDFVSLAANDDELVSHGTHQVKRQKVSEGFYTTEAEDEQLSSLMEIDRVLEQQEKNDSLLDELFEKAMLEKSPRGLDDANLD